MNKSMAKILAIMTSLLIVVITLLLMAICGLREENARLKNNQDVLLAENRTITAESQRYKVCDSLNAIRASRLELTLKEYKNYRSNDLKLIKQLKTKRASLEKIITSKSETITALSVPLIDSVKVDTASGNDSLIKCFSYTSEWTDIKGCADLEKDTVSLQINNRESLKVVESVTYKRFLGFLWKTSKVKSRQVDVVSENPNTKITNCEYVSITP